MSTLHLITAELEQKANKEKTLPLKAYMKDHFCFFGV